MLISDNLNIKWKWAALFCCLLLVFLSACATAPTVPKERPASLVIEPASGKAAAAIKITGSKFLPNENIDIIMQVGDVYHGLGTEKADTLTADNNGQFNVSSGIPVRTPPGMYKIEAVGNMGSVANFSLEVLK